MTKEQDRNALPPLPPKAILPISKELLSIVPRAAGESHWINTVVFALWVRHIVKIKFVGGGSAYYDIDGFGRASDGSVNNFYGFRISGFRFRLSQSRLLAFLDKTLNKISFGKLYIRTPRLPWLTAEIIPERSVEHLQILAVPGSRFNEHRESFNHTHDKKPDENAANNKSGMYG